MLDFYIETWNYTGNSLIWVEVPNPGTTTIYMFYGNPNATTISNATNTFDYFSSFENSWEGWTTQAGMSNDYIILNNTNSFHGNWSFLCWSQIGTTGQYTRIVKSLYFPYPRTLEFYEKGSGSLANYKKIAVWVDANRYILADINSLSYTSWTLFSKTSIPAGTHDIAVGVYVNSNFNGFSSSTYFDAVRIRKYYPLQINTTLGSEYNLLKTIKWAPVRYKYMREIILTPPTPVTDYQIKVELNPLNFDYSKVDVNGSDIRFGDKAENLLSYWIEEWDIGRDSTIWVKVPTSGTSSIYMFYGNPSAFSMSNGSSTFDHYSSFEGASWDGWTKEEGMTNDYIILNDTKSCYGNWSVLFYSIQGTTGQYSIINQTISLSTTSTLEFYEKGWASQPNYKRLSVWINTTRNTITDLNNLDNNFWTLCEKENIPAGTYPIAVGIYTNSNFNGMSTYTYIDGIRIRKYNTTVPNVGVGNEIDIFPVPFDIGNNANDPDTDGLFDISWTESENAVNYTLYEHTSYIYTVNSSITLNTFYTNETQPISLNEGGSWFYKIVAYNKWGNTSTECIRINVTVNPWLPYDLNIDYATPNNYQEITLTWTKARNADYYSIYESNSLITNIEDNVNLIADGIEDTSYTIGELEDGRHYFVVVAYNEHGYTISNCESITIQNPPILLIVAVIVIASVVGAMSLLLYLRKSRLKTVELREKESELLVLKNEISEDDIKIAKERRICLVHKGPIVGFSFICPNCGDIYCEKCFKAIEEIENACWSCSSPLDPSKAPKTIKKKEIDAEISEEKIEVEGVKLKKQKEMDKSPKKSN